MKRRCVERLNAAWALGEIGRVNRENPAETAYLTPVIEGLIGALLAGIARKSIEESAGLLAMPVSAPRGSAESIPEVLGVRRRIGYFPGRRLGPG